MAVNKLYKADPVPISRGGTDATYWEDAADNLKAVKAHPINSGDAITTSVKRKISFSSTTVGLLFVAGSSAARCGAYIVYGSTSSVVVEPIKDATACTIATGTGYFTITSNSGNLYANLQTRSNFSRFSESAAT